MRTRHAASLLLVLVGCSASVTSTPTGTPGAADAALLAVVDDVAPARWNTPDGSKPTQEQANAMPMPPGIYRRVLLRVVKTYAGDPATGKIATWAHYGTVGADSWSDCTFPSAASDVIWDGSPFIAGRRFVAFLDGDGIIADLLSVNGTTVVGHGLTESLP